MSFVINHNVNDNVLVLVVTFAGVEEPVNTGGCTSDIEACPSKGVQILGYYE
jgi:hypothetical protein